MNKTFLGLITAMVMLASCSSSENEDGYKKMDLSTVRLGSTVSANFTDQFAGPGISIGSSASAAKAKLMTRGETEFLRDDEVDLNQCKYASAEAVKALEQAYGCFFVRIDSKQPDTESGTSSIGQQQSLYYPQTDSHKTLFALKRAVAPAKMGDITASNELVILDETGLNVRPALLDPPTIDDLRPYLVGQKVTYHDTVIFDDTDENNKVDLLDDYGIIWYVIKYQKSDKVIHVDGVLEDKTKIITTPDATNQPIVNTVDDYTGSTPEIEVPTGLDGDLVLEVDDFDVRCSGVQEYVAYAKNGNTLDYNGLTITRGSNMTIQVTGLNKLDWSQENTIWTFEAYLWAHNLTPDQLAAWAMNKGEEQYGVISDNPRYNIQYSVFRNFQSNGTVPYEKVSIHVTKL